MAKRFANSGDPDQTPHNAASDLGLHCLPISFYGSPDYSGLNLLFIENNKTFQKVPDAICEQQRPRSACVSEWPY